MLKACLDGVCLAGRGRGRAKGLGRAKGRARVRGVVRRRMIEGRMTVVVVQMVLRL